MATPPAINQHSSIVMRAQRIRERLQQSLVTMPAKSPQQQARSENLSQLEASDRSRLDWSKVDTTSDETPQVGHNCTSQA